MYVEDNAINLGLVKRIAKMGNHEVISFANGQDALDALETEEVDLILMDIELEGEMNGIDVVKRLRARGDERPIVAVTAYAMVGDKERILEAGCNGYLPKPLPVAQFLNILAKYDPVNRTQEMITSTVKSTQTMPVFREPKTETQERTSLRIDSTQTPAQSPSPIETPIETAKPAETPSESAEKTSLPPSKEVSATSLTHPTHIKGGETPSPVSEVAEKAEVVTKAVEVASDTPTTPPTETKSETPPTPNKTEASTESSPLEAKPDSGTSLPSVEVAAKAITKPEEKPKEVIVSESPEASSTGSGQDVPTVVNSSATLGKEASASSLPDKEQGHGDDTTQ
jgi:two-component system cell cycle response regulator DivK